MATALRIDPITRIEGHLSIEVAIDTVNGVQQVVDAWATGTLFRGFEKLLVGRDPRDAQHITQRICGVCPTPHGVAATSALENAYKLTVPTNARVLRNLVLACNFIQSHILSFYHLSLLDFVDGANMAPWGPGWASDKRLDSTKEQQLFANYVKALDITRKVQEMGAVFGGRLPHSPAYVAGGFTETPTSADVTKFKSYLAEVTAFINNVYIPDVNYIASAYSDYYAIGRGFGNLLAFGVFPLDANGSTNLLKRGRVVSGSSSVQTVDAGAITEQVKNSWYADSTTNLNPAQGQTTPAYPKGNAYSWLKSPRYLNESYECGPLSRMWVNGDYRKGISVMDRHVSRALEAKKIADALTGWLGGLTIGQAVYKQPAAASSANGIGLTEAPRGALGHWLTITSGKIQNYQVITPTCWNASPRDNSEIEGPIEMALVGTPVKNIAEPIEVLRVVHSFDPCMSCAVHVVQAEKVERSFTVTTA